MDTGKKPHSREKKVAEGTTTAYKGRKVSTGGQGVGSGGRTSTSGAAGGDRFADTPRSSRAAGSAPAASVARGFLRLPKTLRIIILLAIAAFVIWYLVKGQGAGSVGSGVPDSSAGYAAADTETSGADYTVADTAREKRFRALGGGRDTVTVMVYMCGTDLESKYGMATSDLKEMTNATIADNVNVIVETGGCKTWKNSIVSNAVNQIYKVESGGLRCVNDNCGTAAMTDPANLTSFIDYCEKNYAANRYILIFWDHGGGSLTGYGYDEKHAGSGSMDLAEINDALKSADCVFDWIGFDACLMATLETAQVCNSYADYLIASEETEPGTGWYYTNWLTMLSEDTSVPTVKLAECLIDDFVEESVSATPSAKVTLSVVDLAELQGTVPKSFNSFAVSTSALLESDDYAVVSDARASALQFAQSSRINQIDLADFARRMDTDEADALVSTLRGCVKYNRTTIPNAYGLSIYFPYESLNSMNSAVSTYNELGFDSAYTKCIRSFASMATGGQIAANTTTTGYGMNLGSLLGTAGSSSGGFDVTSLLGNVLTGTASGSGSSGTLSSAASSPIGSLLGSYLGASGNTSAGGSLNASTVMSLLSAFSGRSMPAGYEWLDTEAMESSKEYIAANYIDPGDIFTTIRSDGTRVLSLTAEQWALIQAVELNIFADDGAGYIDLGLDNVFAFDGDDLLLDFDNTWLTVNGQAVAYYLVSDIENSDGSYTTRGRIPALLNGTAVNLDVVFDAEHPYGVITGASPLYEEETEALPKGSIEVVEGDELEFLCDYYAYDGTYSDSYVLGEPLTVSSKGLVLANMKLDQKCSVTYRLTDIYGNRYWTPAWITK